jgi:hypothetical protein
MKWQTSALEYIARKNLYFSRPPIPSQNFETFCRDREISLSRGQLERLDQTGFLKPLGRYKRQKNIIKIEQTADGIKELGMLEDSEQWAGMTHERVSAFSPRFLREYFDQGQILDSEQVPTDGWDSSELINFYSEFQLYPLWTCLNLIRVHCPTIDEIATKSDEELADNMATTCKLLRDQIPVFVELLQTSKNAALVCQAISNRYHPVTQTDQRTIRVSSVIFDWDWHEYCRTWNAKQTAEEMGVDAGDIFNMWKHVKSDASRVDPLREWDDLLKFIAVSERDRLKGKALLAYSLKNMAAMLALFYEDVFGKPISEQYPPRRAILAPNEEADGTLRELEYITNKYNLNPRPRLILVVEGESEAEQIPRLIEHFWGHGLSKAGIEILNLKGVSKFAGNHKKSGKPSRDSSPLKRLIDDYHNRQTIIYILLDNEGGAAFVKNELSDAASEYFGSRAVTKEEFIHIWNINYEFDNFSNTEIASGMSVLAPNVLFSEREVEQARQDPNAGSALKRLFETKTASPLSKRSLNKELTSLLIAEAEASGILPQRPILDQLDKITRLAATNHQPTSGESWETNQQSGYFGKKIP